MEPFAIKQATFLTSVGLGTPYPPAVDTGVEIAMVGKSNVGKSSLINSLCNNFKLARVSSSPGKTRLINYFLINREFYLVDLPGYGFAKAPKTEQQKWGEMTKIEIPEDMKAQAEDYRTQMIEALADTDDELMESYLSSGRVTHIFLLLDIRHAPTAEDKQMFQWILYYGVPFTLVATKADKLAKSKRAQAANAAAKLLGAPPAALAYSSETGDGRQMLLDTMGNIVKDHISLHNPKTPIDIDTSLLHNME